MVGICFLHLSKCVVLMSSVTRVVNLPCLSPFLHAEYSFNCTVPYTSHTGTRCWWLRRSSFQSLLVVTLISALTLHVCCHCYAYVSYCYCLAYPFYSVEPPFLQCTAVIWHLVESLIACTWLPAHHSPTYLNIYCYYCYCYCCYLLLLLLLSLLFTRHGYLFSHHSPTTTAATDILQLLLVVLVSVLVSLHVDGCLSVGGVGGWSWCCSV